MILLDMLPREKLRKRGISVLSDIELVQILVGSGIKGANFQKISKLIIKRIKESATKDKGLEVSQLTTIDGVGDVIAMRILCGIELGKRVYGLFNEQRSRILNSQDAYEIVRDMSNLKRERVDILCLNSRFEYLCRESIALGSLNCANLSPREVIYTAIEKNSAFVIMVHNHPSGDSTPSKEDILLTKTITSALDLVGVQLLDHIVVGKNSWSSVEV